jgi:hypothetical protein
MVTRWMFVLMCSTPGWGHLGQRPAPHRPWSVVLRVRKLTWIVLLPWNSTLKDGVVAHPAPEGVAGDDSARVGSASCDPASEGVAGDDPARMGSANYDPAPEGVRAGSPSGTSMDVHVGSPPHSGCMVVAQAFGQGAALEASVPDDKVLGSAGDTELVRAGSLQVAPGGDPSPSHQLISHDLGVPSFFSNLQVLWSILV